MFEVTELVKHVSTEPVLLRSLLADLAEWFAHSKRWNRRQTFALLCSQLVVKQILSEELFACDVFPHLLDLSWDPVPNVRLSVARTLATNIAVQSEYIVYIRP
jgi:serine/threonine-protein phosphatase 4 regulatory subunit 1